LAVQEKLVQLLREETTKMALVQEVDAFVEAKAQGLAELVEQAREAAGAAVGQCMSRVAWGRAGERDTLTWPWASWVGAQRPTLLGFSQRHTCRARRRLMSWSAR
jgi:hypothetical protein